MKKKLSRKNIMSVLMLVFLLCGCGSEVLVTPVTRQISFTAEITYYNECFVCEAAVDENGVMEMTVQSPEALRGLRFTLDGQDTTAELMGLTYTPRSENMPFVAVSRTLYDLLTDCAEQHLEREDGNCVYSGTAGERPFTVTFAPSGLPIKAEIPDDSFTVEFRDMTLL